MGDSKRVNTSTHLDDCRALSEYKLPTGRELASAREKLQRRGAAALCSSASLFIRAFFLVRLGDGVAPIEGFFVGGTLCRRCCCITLTEDEIAQHGRANSLRSRAPIKDKIAQPFGPVRVSFSEFQNRTGISKFNDTPVLLPVKVPLLVKPASKKDTLAIEAVVVLV